ncbi:hypothetical protein HIM_05256 [Hirsutella minnesotensis 3608]|uniref:Uncharacterized protein n=1 Tax=Hirsutella minnesotensis 3608 TaxID=1043627 RepID=A0A0F7ZPD9_9HYPO|nr:hypothetical protein HIM_05256 [Hirsutella minnesotensis 3608]
MALLQGMTLAVLATGALSRVIPATTTSAFINDAVPEINGSTRPGLLHLSADKPKILDRRIEQILAQIAAKPTVRGPAPFFNSPTTDEPTCFQHWNDCARTQFWSHHLLVEAHNATGSVFSSLEKEVDNNSPQDVKIEVTETHAVIDGTTTGWKIGGKATAGFGKSGVASGGIEVSTEYSSLHNQQDTWTESIKYSYSCPPWSVCRIETLTFNVNIMGTCEETGYLQCAPLIPSLWHSDYTWSACDIPSALSCNQYTAFGNKYCPKPKRPCSVSTPIFNEDGKEPFAITAFIAYDSDDLRSPQTIRVLNDMGEI